MNMTKLNLIVMPFGHLDRSQSVGPIPSNVDGSPKRQIRSGSAAPASATAQKIKKTPVSTPTIVEKRPRPSKFHLAHINAIYVLTELH